MKIEFHADALQELKEAANYYESTVPGLGVDLSDEIDAALDRLHVNPDIGAVVEPPFRRIVLNRFPFSVMYRLKGTGALILAIAHHSRRPGYWRTRK